MSIKSQYGTISTHIPYKALRQSSLKHFFICSISVPSCVWTVCCLWVPICCMVWMGVRTIWYTFCIVPVFFFKEKYTHAFFLFINKPSDNLNKLFQLCRMAHRCTSTFQSKLNRESKVLCHQKSRRRGADLWPQKQS